ncbi:hypothetical protein [Vibrio sp. 10N.261.55.A7]|uniref:hypothetical protein n=1 Tax=Vibrio sp. 10N.261.55.A7 TaxID=1880851 RepID=UPI000C8562B1|nr:hypothetical protein [Vibrio sp. 10N.261.55.A7]PMK05145.1 hypothetical protein BCU12_00300 [Vibrio sp. 10N.261.55.A7]
MVQYLLSLFPAMLLGTQLVLTIILLKGDICPGQRGRIHKTLPAIGVLWLAVASLKIEAFMVVFALFYFYSQVKTGKTRDSGPVWLLYLANGLALSFVGIQISMQATTAQSLAYFVLVFLLGASFSHLLLTIARTRLQAFHKILPVTGVIAAMAFVMSVLVALFGVDEAQLEMMLTPLIVVFALLIMGVASSCLHLVTSKEINKVPLAIALLLLLSSATLSSGLLAV